MRPRANSGNWARNAVTNAALVAADGSLLTAGAGAGAGDVVDVAATAGVVVVEAADVAVAFSWEVSLALLHPVRATAAAIAMGKAIRRSFTADDVKRCVCVRFSGAG